MMSLRGTNFTKSKSCSCLSVSQSVTHDIFAGTYFTIQSVQGALEVGVKVGGAYKLITHIFL